MDAGIEPAAIGIVVVADQTIDGDVLAVIEIERQRCARLSSGSRSARRARLGMSAASAATVSAMMQATSVE